MARATSKTSTRHVNGTESASRRLKQLQTMMLIRRFEEKSAEMYARGKIKGFLADKPSLTLTINRSDLEQTMVGAKTLEAQIADGTAKVDGDASVLKQLASTMVDFDPRFEIMPGTKARAKVAHADPYEAVPGKTIAE